jgi:predicted component of type VI protein secretion system
MRYIQSNDVTSSNADAGHGAWMKAELVPENGDPPIPINRDLMVVGRREYCDIVIDHSSLSKRHCVLVKTDGLLVIRDLISTNGTKVKGQKIRWAALLPDDRITFGSYKLRVYLGPDDIPGPSELYRARHQRSASGRKRSTGDARSIEAQTLRSGSSRAAGVAVNGGFASPSPLAIPVPSSDDFPVIPSSRRPQDDEPLIPIDIDDSDEIIDLD